jgi:hypothetical protein
MFSEDGLFKSSAAFHNLRTSSNSTIVVVLFTDPREVFPPKPALADTDRWPASALQVLDPREI